MGGIRPPPDVGLRGDGREKRGADFIDFFREAAKKSPVEDFIPPPGVEFVRIDMETGLRAIRVSQKAGFEVFLQGTAPTQYAGTKEGRTDVLFRPDGNILPQARKTSR
ncbi:MAG: hypothetical protein QGI11_14145 [Nitrospinota bacterium]|nr:hypothetical protein [Nitrospinota bacterium]